MIIRFLIFTTRNEVGTRILSTEGGGIPGQVPTPGQVHPQGRYIPQAGTPPSLRQVHPQTGTPPGQVPPTQGRETPQAGTPPWVGTPPEQVPPGQVHPPHQCMLGYGQQAGWAHPTGMHSFFLIYAVFAKLFSDIFCRFYDVPEHGA